MPNALFLPKWQFFALSLAYVKKSSNFVPDFIYRPTTKDKKQQYYEERNREKDGKVTSVMVTISERE